MVKTKFTHFGIKSWRFICSCGLHTGTQESKVLVYSSVDTSGQFWHNTVSFFMAPLREAVKTAMCENSFSTSKAYLLVFVICRVNTSCNTVNWTPLEVAEAGKKAIAKAVSCVCLCMCVCLCVCVFLSKRARKRDRENVVDCRKAAGSCLLSYCSKKSQNCSNLTFRDDFPPLSFPHQHSP